MKQKRERLYSQYNGHCAYCGKSISRSEMTIDHIVPKSKGGSNDDDNLLPACRACNLGKGRMSLEEFSEVYFENSPNPKVEKFYFERQSVPSDSEAYVLMEDLLLQNAYLLYCIEHISRHDDSNSELSFFLRMARRKYQKAKTRYENMIHQHNIPTNRYG